jgi:hypothetical protein
MIFGYPAAYEWDKKPVARAGDAIVSISDPSRGAGVMHAKKWGRAVPVWLVLRGCFFLILINF